MEVDETNALVFVPQCRIGVFELKQHALHVVGDLGCRQTGTEARDDVVLIALILGTFFE